MLPDRQARDQVVGALRSLLAGQLTADEFESRVPARSSDPAIRALLSENAWRLYGGAQRGGQHLADQDRAAVSRWQLFLKTDRPYEWPAPDTRRLHSLAAVVTFGLTAKLVRRRARQSGDLEVWPFLRRADYDAAMRSPATL